MESISPEHLQALLQKQQVVLIDVREPWEHTAFNIGGQLIPMDDIMQQVPAIPKDKRVVFYCEKGIRSGIIIQRLEQRFGFQNLLNLAGGMNAWRKVFPSK